jgi:hypothetical protein
MIVLITTVNLNNSRLSLDGYKAFRRADIGSRRDARIKESWSTDDEPVHKTTQNKYHHTPIQIPVLVTGRQIPLGVITGRVWDRADRATDDFEAKAEKANKSKDESEQTLHNAHH